jgi:hypothetical protein
MDDAARILNDFSFEWLRFVLNQVQIEQYKLQLNT